MKYIKIAFSFAVLVAIVAIAPNFSVALTVQDNGTTAGTGSNLTIQDNGSTAGSGSAALPPIQDNGTTAGAGGSNLPPVQDNGTTAGTGDSNLPPVQDNGTTAGGGGSTPPTQDNGNTAGSSGGSRGGRSPSPDTTEISDIKVTPAGSTVAATTLTRGQTYVISWSASNDDVNTAINLISVSTGASIFIGVSENPDAVNTFTWTVPASLAGGNYVIRFTDESNHTTDSSNMYTVRGASSPSGSPSGNTGGNGNQEQTLGEETSELPLVVGSEDSLEVDPDSQVAAAGGATGFFSKYFLWFLILLLVIVGIILAREQRNKTTPPANKNTPPTPPSTP